MILHIRTENPMFKMQPCWISNVGLIRYIEYTFEEKVLEYINDMLANFTTLKLSKGLATNNL